MRSKWMDFFHAKVERLKEEIEHAKRQYHTQFDREKLLKEFRDGQLCPTEDQIEELYLAIRSESQDVPICFLQQHANTYVPKDTSEPATKR